MCPTLPENYKVEDALSYHYEPVEIGEEYFMFGYPGTVDNTYADHANTPKIPFPVIRKGIAAHFGAIDDISYIMLDAIAVRGFSGSPVVGFDKTKNAHVIGIATNGNQEAERVVDKDGNYVDYFSFSPTGFTKAIHILYVIDAIEQNDLV